MTVKIGIVGLGDIGREHAYRCHNILNGVQLVAVADPNIKTSKSFLQTHKINVDLY